MSNERKTRRKKGEEALALAIACGATVEAAATRAGVSTRTAYRRLSEETFSDRIKQIQRQMTQRSLAMLIAAGQLAAKTMVNLMEDAIPPAARLGAAKSVLDLGTRVRDLDELT